MSLGSLLTTLFLREKSQIGYLRSLAAVEGWSAFLPHHSLAEAPVGKRCVVQGRVRAFLPLHRSPISGRESVFTQVQIENYDSEGRRIERSTFEYGTDFMLHDSSASALVRRGLLSLEHNDAATAMLNFKAMTAQELSENAAFWMQQRSWPLGRHFTYREWSIGPGDLVRMIGCVRDGAPDPSALTAETAGGYRAAPRGLVVDAADDALFLYLSLLPEP